MAKKKKKNHLILFVLFFSFLNVRPSWKSELCPVMFSYFQKNQKTIFDPAYHKTTIIV